MTPRRGPVIRTSRERREARLRAGRQCRRSLARLTVCVPVLLGVLGRVVPGAGCAAAWLTPLLLLPGAALTLLLCALMRRTGTRSLPDCASRLLGEGGGRALMALLGAMACAEGAASLTALIALFTGGIDTEGTQLTLAALSCGALLLCLHGDGLPRAVHLLRGVLLGVAALWAADTLTGAHLDGLWPPLGGGAAALRQAAQAGLGLSWPLTLLTVTAPVREKTDHRRELPLPLVALVAAPVLLVLAVPHEVLTACASLPEALLLPVRWLHPAVRTLTLCLLMLGLFLSVAGLVHTASALSGLRGAAERWLARALLAALLLTQLVPAEILWSVFGVAQPWLLGAAMAMTGLLWAAYLVGGGRCRA